MTSLSCIVVLLSWVGFSDPIRCHLCCMNPGSGSERLARTACGGWRPPGHRSDHWALCDFSSAPIGLGPVGGASWVGGDGISPTSSVSRLK